MDRIKVGVKVRPLIQREKASGSKEHWRAASENSVTQIDPATGGAKGEPFTFDHVFGPDSSNREVFEVLVKPIVESAVKGFNGTIFAYGQTASGKTYTMMGDQFEPGIIPQAINLIFNLIENSHGRQFLLRVCYMEIYNEKIHDLLCKSNRNLKISEDNQGNVFVKDLEESITSSSQMVMDLMKRGETIRKIGVTNMNERSSRSHSIFRVIIESRAADSETDEAIQVSHLNLVDLAGSERAGATGSVGDQFKEGCAINKSLFTLGKVISQLSEGESSYVNFRDSKLTRILQSSLGGNALTAIVCAITPAALEETSSTLGFASRARNIQNTAQVNEVLTERALLKRYIKQINLLKSEISTLEEAKSVENKHLQDQNVLLQERLSRLKDALLVSNSDDTDQSEKCREKLRKLRRRTWSAPNRQSRLSLAFPLNKKKTESISCLDNIHEEDSRLSMESMKSDLDDSMFATPLEEFEKALIKAERDKSIDWLPSADLLEEETFSRSIEGEVENAPALNYVQTRRNRGHHLVDDFVVETPPAKLRDKIRNVEKELEDLNEFTKLEKQMFDESLIEENKALSTELKRVKIELEECVVECNFLKDIKIHLESLKLSDKNSHDLQVLLLDTTKEVSKLSDEKKELARKLSDAEAQSIDANKMKEELDKIKTELLDSRKEKLRLKTSMAKQEEQLTVLQNEKDDFDFQFELMRGNYDKKLKDLTQALEDARHELNTPHHVSRHNDNGGLYSVAEETTVDELVQQLEVLKEENQDLLQQMNRQSCDIEQLTITNTELLDSLNSKESELAKYSDEIQSLRDSISRFEADVIEADSELKLSSNSTDVQINVDAEVESLKISNDALKEELASKEEVIRLSAIELESLKSQLNELDHLPLQSLKLDNANCSNCMELDEKLCAAKLLLCSNMDEINCDESITLESLIQLLQVSLKDIREKCNVLEECNEVCKHELKSSEVELDVLQKRCEKLEEECNQIHNMLSETQYFNDGDDMSLVSMVEKLLSVCLESETNRCDLKETSVSFSSNYHLEDDAAAPCEETSNVDTSGIESKMNAKLESLKEEVITMRSANDVLAAELEAKEHTMRKSAIEMDQLRAQIVLLESAPEELATSRSLEAESSTVEIENLEMINKNLISDLAEKDKLVNEAAVEMEHLREQILKLECIKSETAAVNLSNSVSDSRLLDSEEQVNLKEKMQSLADETMTMDHVDNDLETLQERCYSAEEELRLVRSMLCQREENINENTSLASLISDLLASCGKNLSAETENCNNVSHVMVDATSEALVEHQKRIDELVSTKNSLMSELDCKNSVLADTEVELKQLKERVQELSGKSPAEQNPTEQLLHLKNDLVVLKSEKEALEIELESKHVVIKESQQELEQVRMQAQDLLKTLQDMSDESCHKCTVFSNELASSQKILSNELQDEELNQKTSIPDLVDRILILFNRVNEESAELKQAIQNETNLRLVIQEEVSSLQKRCESLTSEIFSAQNTLLSEVKSITGNANIEELPLPSLVSEFLSSVMAAQQHVASVMQLKIDNCTNELEATSKRENECQKIIEELRCEVKHYIHRNEVLKDALEDLKQEEHDTLCLVDTIKRLKLLVGAVESISHDELVLTFENKLLTLRSKSDEVEHLQSDIKQQLSECDSLRSSNTCLEKQVSELKEMIMILEQSATEANQALMVKEENSELLKEETANERSLAIDLKMEIAHKEELVEKLERQLSELQLRVDIQSGEIGLVDRKADISSKEEELHRLEAKLQQTLLDLTREGERCVNLSEENSTLLSTITALEKVVSEQKEIISDLELSASEAKQSLIEKEENSEQLNEEMLNKCGLANDSKMEIRHQEHLSEKLGMQSCELQQSENDQSHAMRLVEDSISSDIISKTEHLHQLEAKLQQALLDLTKEGERYNTLYEKNLVLQSTIIALERQVSDLTLILEQSTPEVQQALIVERENLEHLKKETSNEKSQGMETANKDLVEKLERELSELQQMVVAQSGKIELVDSLTAEIVSKEAEIQQLEAKLQEALLDRSKEEERHNLLSEENSNLQYSIGDLDKQVLDQKEMITKLELSVFDAEKEASHERSLANNLKAEIASREELVEKLNKQLGELQQRIDDQSGKIDLIDGLKADIVSREEELHQMEAKLQKALLDQTKEEERNNLLSEENSNLKSSIGDLDKQVVDQNEIIAILKLSVSHAEKEASHERSLATDLKAEITLQKELVDKLEKQLSELQLRIDDQSGKIDLIDGLKADIVSREEELHQLEAQLQQALLDLSKEGERCNSLSDENLKLKSTISAFEMQVSELKQIIVDLEGSSSQANQAREAIEEQLGKLNELIKSKEVLEEELKNQLSEEKKQSKVQEEKLTQLHQELQAQIKLVAGKDLLHNKATSMYNELSEKKELIKRLESDLSTKSLNLQESEQRVQILEKQVENLEQNKITLQSDLLKSKAEKDVALKNLALKSSVTPSEAVKELKAENEFLKQQHEEVLKSSRDMRTRNRKLQAELNKLKEKLEEDKKSTSGEVAILQGRLHEEISKREELENQLDEICKLERSKTNRVSDLRKKRASLDIKHSKEEKYKLELSTKSEDLTDLNKIVKEKEEMIGRLQAQLEECQECTNKLERISELEKDKTELDKECEELLSWGRSHETENNKLIDKLAEAFKTLAQTTSKLTKVTIGKIQLLSNLCKETVSALDRVTSEQIEMQLSSKEKATRNANGRIAEFDIKIEEATCNISVLENLCANLLKESEVILSLDDETAAIWKKIANQKQQSSNHCIECSNLSQWGKEEEAKKIELGNHVSRLEEKIRLLEHEKGAYLMNTRSRRKPVDLGDDERLKSQCSECGTFKEVLQDLRREIADKKAEVVTLKNQQLLQNKPFEETIKRLESQIARFKDENSSLKAEIRRTMNNPETSMRETKRRASKVNISTQTTETTSEIYRSQYWSGAPSGIVEEANKALLETRCKKLEQEKELYKTLCVKRKERIESLERERNQYFNQENKENDEQNRSTYFTRSRKNN